MRRLAGDRTCLEGAFGPLGRDDLRIRRSGMREITTWRRSAAVISIVALTLIACGGDDGGDDADPADEEIATDIGVTDEPCPEPTNDGNGCIYLGVLSDLTQGPFAPLGVEIVEGQRAFFQRVNDQGGIAGYDVDIDTYTRDNLYDRQE